MSFLRYAKKVDLTQTDIVNGLRKCGYQVVVSARPTDLIVRHPSWRANCFALLECKTKKSGKHYVARKDQVRQAVFCQAHGIPYVGSAEEALEYLQVHGIKLMEAA